MIYVIASAALKNGSLTEYETIIKIGYTKDERGDGRFDDYSTTNPTCKVLFKIPEGHSWVERKLHLYFREFQYPGTKEWFYYNEEIIEFFKINSNIGLIDKELRIWFFENNTDNAYTESLSFLKNLVWQYSVESDKALIIKAEKDIITEYNKEKAVYWLNNYCGCCLDVATNLVQLYNNTKSRITPEMSEFICKMQDFNTPIEKRLQELYESKFTDEDKKLIARQISSWFNKFGNILGLDRCSELNYNISDIVREELFIEYKDEISAAIYKYFKVGDIYSEEEVSKQLLEIFGRYGICNTSINLIDFIKKYFEVNIISVDKLELLKRTNIFKRRYSSLNSRIETRENACTGFWEVSEDIYKEFLVGKTYKHDSSKYRIIDICRKRGILMDYIFDDPEGFLSGFFKISVYDTTVSSEWAVEKRNIIDEVEIDILEKLNPPSEQD